MNTKNTGNSSSVFKEITELHWYQSGRPFKVGIILTLLWVALALLYISLNIGWSQFVKQPLDVIGSFFEGAFAPLLFLWIVVGFFSQQKDIMENAKNIARQVQQTQLNTFLSVSEMVLQQLGVISGHIYLATQGPLADGRETEESASALWTQFHQDDRVFIRKLLEYGSAAESPGKLKPEIYFGNEAVKRNTKDYIRTFEKLIINAQMCDPDFVIRDALLTGTAQGILYRTIMDAKSKMDMGQYEEKPPLKSVS